MKHNYFRNLFTALLLLCSTVAFAHDFEVDGIYYNITDDVNKTVEVTYKGSYSSEYSNEYSGAVNIPASVTYNGTTYSVTSIGESAFSGCSGLTSIEIPNSVLSIGDMTFSGCSGLTSIEIPNSVLSIGYETFSSCSGLTNVVIPNNVTSIGWYAFSNCTGLTSIEIPNSVTSIEGFAFAYCSRLTSIEIPNSVLSIGESAFEGCSGLTSVIVADGNTVYDSRNNCNAIIETETNTLILGCKNTIIPNSVTSIGESAFYYCSGLTGELVIPNSVTSIGGNAFYYCTGLTGELVIPNSVTSIEPWTFFGCSSLISVVIGNSVTSIGYKAFQGCSGLTSVVIPNCVTSIGDYAFQGCTGLTSVVIPNSVTSIESYAFYNCSGLTSVVIPNSVTTIEDEAFRYCSGLTSIVIGNSVTYIGESAFANCTELLDVYCFAKNVPGTAATAFKGSYPEYINLHVLPEAISSYQTTEPWSTFGNIIPLPFELTVTAAGYATLYLDYAAEIPAGVEVYTANAVEGEYLKMQLVEGVIPANTGVIVKAAAGTYTFNGVNDTTPAIEDNLFCGSIENETISVPSGKAAYVLSMVDGEVGMYRAELTNGAFLNNANKAYLLLDSNKLGIYDEKYDTSVGGQLSNGFRFDFSGITGVSEVKVEDGKVEAIYDLQGRVVENPVNGIYIINGKKVLVK